MSDAKASVATFFAWILGELSLIGRFAAFFGTILLLWGVASPEPARLLPGFALVFLCVADRYWSDKYPAVSYEEEAVPWYRKVVWGKIFLSVLFFVAFLITAYFWMRLDPVREFMKQAGIGGS